LPLVLQLVLPLVLPLVLQLPLACRQASFKQSERSKICGEIRC